jgi:restriction endonuclease Mrr
MNKSREKNKEKWNQDVIKSLADKYDFSTRYIKQCITGDRTPVFADRIKKEYVALKKEIEGLLASKEI